MLLCVGCASEPTALVVPEGLLVCPEPPVVPGDDATAREVGEYIGALAAAGEVCRTHLGAVMKLLKEQAR